MNKLVATILVFSVFFTSSLFAVPKASAYWGVMDTNSNPALEALTGADMASSMASWGESLANWALQVAYAVAINYLKKKLIEKIMDKIEKKAKLRMITNYTDYLYTKPATEALNSTKSFLTSTVGNKRSGYEGYLNAAALASVDTLAGNVSIKTNLSSYAPRANKIFDGKNLRAFSSYFECANNVFCLSLSAKGNYTATLEKKQTIAKAESPNGYMPKKDSKGNITSPAINISTAVSSSTTMAVNSILNINADDKSSATTFANAISAIITSYLNKE